MNIQNLSRHVRLVIRGEILVAQAKLAHAMRRGTFLAFALLFAGLGLVFINIGLYEFLLPLWGTVWTPVGLGLINAALAVAALLIAATLKPGAELAMAEEIRAMAGQSLEAEVNSASLGSVLGGGGLQGAAVTGLLIPAITSIVRGLGKRRKSEG